MLRLEGIVYDRQTTWPTSSASESGVNGFVAIKTLEKPFSGKVLGLKIELASGTKVLLKYIGQFKHWIDGFGYGDRNLMGTGIVEDNMTVTAEQINKLKLILLQDVKNMITDLEASKRSDQEKDYWGYEMLKNLLTYSEEYDEKLVKVGKYLQRITIQEAKNQQKAAKLGVAPKVYGYNENPLQWCMTMEFLKDAVYNESSEESYLDTKVIPIHVRQQLVALCHILDMNGIVHNDLKPDNYRMRNNRLYIIDYGLSKDVGEQHYSNVNCLSWGGWTFFARPNTGMFGFGLKNLKPLKLQEHLQYMKFNHNKAKQNGYRVGDVVLMNEGKRYMLYRCTKLKRQDEIYFPGLKIKGKGGKREKIILTPGTKENKPLNTTNTREYFKYVVQPKLGVEDYTVFKKSYNVWDRPAWKAMWIHPSIPFSLEECLEAHRNKVWRRKIKL
jgi:predicted Ser/Thr protein kinase